MRFKFLLSIIIAFSSLTAISQDEDPRKKEKLYKKYSALAAEQKSDGEFAQAEALYRKALDKKPEGDEAAYNFGNLYFENQKTKESAMRYLESAEASEDKMVKHKNFHNLGNLMMEQEQYDKAVEAYKNALRNNPNDEETRYNLALAKQKKEKQKNDGGGQDKNKDKNKEKKDKQDDKDKGGEGNNKDQKEKDKQNSKDGQDEKESKKKDENANKDPKDGDQQKQQKPSKPQKGKMSEQQIKNLLQAIENKVKNTQEKLNAKKVKGPRVKTEKDW